MGVTAIEVAPDLWRAAQELAESNGASEPAISMGVLVPRKG